MLKSPNVFQGFPRFTKVSKTSRVPLLGSNKVKRLGDDSRNVAVLIYLPRRPRKRYVGEMTWQSHQLGVRLKLLIFAEETQEKGNLNLRLRTSCFSTGKYSQMFADFSPPFINCRYQAVNVSSGWSWAEELASKSRHILLCLNLRFY